MIRHIINQLVQVEELKDQYGWQSCLDVPDAYDEMGEKGTESLMNAWQFANDAGKDICGTNIFTVCQDIAREIVNGNISRDAEIHFYSQDAYIEQYITESMDESAQKVFDSLFYWMNSDDRARWLQSNYLTHDPEAWTDTWSTFVILVCE